MAEKNNKKQEPAKSENLPQLRSRIFVKSRTDDVVTEKVETKSE